MTFKEWKYWLQSYPWTIRWFILIVLVRPIIDNLYSLKNISPFLSPPYIVGVLTPVLVIIALAKYKRPQPSPIDRPFWLWSFLALLGAFCYYLYDPLSLNYVEFVLKLAMPIYLYAFCRLLIRSRRDMEGMLQTFLYSALFVVALFLFEVLVTPIRVEMSRGVERIQGNFADVMNYGFYITLGFLTACYFFFRNRSTKKFTNQIAIVALVTALCTWGLIKINHVASYGVFFFLMVLFFLYNLKKNKGIALLLVMVGVVVVLIVGGDAVNQYIEPLIKTDLEVYEGEKESDKLFHGRVGRWKYMTEEFLNINVFSQFIGMATTFDYTFPYVSSGTHNDYLRIMFFTGYIGFIAFFLFLFRIVQRGSQLATDQRFLVFGALGVLLLYSISANPTIYAPLLYIIFSIFAYVALPRNLQ